MKYNSYGSLGEEALREGKYNDAANLLTKAYDLEPSNVEVLLNLGLALYHLNRNKLAASMFRKAIRLNDQELNAHLGLAHAYKELGNFPKALSEYQFASKLSPDLAVSHIGMADIYSRSDQHQLASEALQIARQLEPDDIEIDVRLADISLYQKDPQKALTYALRSVTLHPNSALSWFVLSRVYLDLREFPLAKEAALKALVYKPDWFAALHILGMAERGMGNNHSALIALDASINSNPYNYFAYSEISNIYLHNLHKPFHAWRIMQKALRTLFKESKSQKRFFVRGD